MKLPRPHRLSEIAELIRCEGVGPPDHEVLGLNEIHMVEPGDVVFVDHPKYYDKALESAATTVLIDKRVEVPAGKALLVSDDPFRDFNALIRNFRQVGMTRGSRGSGVQVHPTAQIHDSVVLGNAVVVGADSVLHPGVTVYDHTVIGERVIVHANSVLGGDAFYYKNRPGGRDKLLSCGDLLIGDDVEIGASCTIDRGVSGSTRIGVGTKLDNQVHIGHDTVIGAHCVIAAQAGIAGCVTVGDRVEIWGQAGIRTDVVIGDRAVVMAQSGISKDLEPGKSYFGSPAGEFRHRMRDMALVRRLPQLLAELRQMIEERGSAPGA